MKQRWRWGLPALAVTAYGAVLWLWKWPPHFGPSSTVSIEFMMPRAVSVFMYLNSPAMVLATVMSGALPDSNADQLFVRLFGLFLLPQWWAVGWWADHFGVRPAVLRTNRVAEVLSDCAFALSVFSMAGICWKIVSQSVDWGLVNFESVIGGILWPAFVILASWRLRAESLAEARRSTTPL